MPKQRTPLNDVPDSMKPARVESPSSDTAKPSEAAGSSEQEQVVLATEQPVPSEPQEKPSEYVVTVDNQTGLPVKIEKLAATGERKELSQEEYEGFSSVGGKAPSGGLASSAETDPLLMAYYQGVADYLNSLT